MTAMPLHLLLLPGTFAVCRLAPNERVPDWATSDVFCSISRSADELSLVCPASAVPAGVRCETGWRCLRVAGTIDFAAVGVLASLVRPLADAGVAVFAVSTFDTDYVLVKEDDLPAAQVALQQYRHIVRPM